MDGPVRRIKRTFKFENWWLKEQDFQQFARNEWRKTTHISFSQRTNKLARGLKVWCRKKKPLQQELTYLEEQINNLQMQPMQQQNFSLENSLVNTRPYIASQLPHDSNDYTNSVPDKQELWETLQEMKKNASPGPDGFNVEFYIATWSWIGDDVINLVEGKRLQSTNRQQQRAMLEGLAQGSTIDTDKKIPGSVIFVDASLKCRDIPDAQDHQTTGIGIFIRAEIARRSCSIKIQAVS